MTIYFWNGATGDASLISNTKILDAAHQLLNGGYDSLEVLNSSSKQPIYSFRLTGAERLLFTTHKGAILLLEHLPTHDYENSHFLKKGVLKAYIQKNEEAISRALTPEERPVFEDKEPHIHRTSIDYFNQQFISLSVNQEAAITMPLPSVVNGAAGSGKSYVALSSLAQYLEQHKAPARLLYVTKKRLLVNEMKATWHAFAPEGKEDAVTFKTYNEIIAEFASTTGQQAFEEWFETYPENVARDALKPTQIYQKFKNASGFYDINAEPLKYEEALHRALTDIHQKYQIHLKQNLQTDFSFCTLAARAEFEEYWKKTSKPQTLTRLSPKQIYQEFRICSGFSLGDYEALGTKESSIPQGPLREAIFHAFTKYKSHLENYNQVNPDFFRLPQLDEAYSPYHLIVVDEAQNLTTLALDQLRQLTANQSILFCMDAHQNLADAQPIRPLLKKILHKKNLTLNNVTLDRTYRCPVNIARVINASIQLKHTLTGGKIDTHEVSEMAADEALGDSTVDLITPDALEAQDWFNTRTRDGHFAIVAPEAYLQEARERFKAALVFTPEQIQGLEYHTVIIYKLFDTDEAKNALKTANTKLEASSSVKTHRAKAGEADNTHATWIHKLYTAYARAKNTLYIVEENNRVNQPFLAQLQTAVDLSVTQPSAEEKTETSPEVLPKTNWAEEEAKQRQEGNHDVANNIRRQYLSPHEATPAIYPKAVLTTASQVEPTNTPNPKKSKKKSKKPSPPKETEQVISFNPQLGENLLEAVQKNNLKKVKKLLQNTACNANHKDNNGFTALMIASSNGYIDIVKVLLNDKKVNPLQKTTNGGFNALMLASKNRMTLLDTIKLLLLDGRIDPNEEANDTFTTLMMATEFGHPDIVQALLDDTRADPNQYTLRGSTALMIASARGQLDIAKLLLADGRTDPNQRDNGGFTALMMAAEFDHPDVVKFLLADRRITPSQRNNHGLTALISAFQAKKFNIVNIFLNTENIFHTAIDILVNLAFWTEKLNEMPRLHALLIKHSLSIWEQLKSPERLGLPHEAHIKILNHISSSYSDHPLRNILFRQKPNGSFFKPESELILKEMQALIEQKAQHKQDEQDEVDSTPYQSI
ncbi:MAG: ankyrin repeat domain-containing protein [Gammaproteobacteria bacterium]|nr:ankyrin repeat domain-containing protein [Gammaproteobacteria bacterium]